MQKDCAERQLREAQIYRRVTCFKYTVRGTIRLQPWMAPDYQIDEETRMALMRKEQWHFHTMQHRWFTILVFVASLFELLIFFLGYFSSDHDFEGKPLPDGKFSRFVVEKVREA